MVKERLSLPDAEENGWLLDGYPRSLSQATALKKFGFEPDLFILLEVRICLSCCWYAITEQFKLYQQLGKDDIDAGS